MAEQLEANCKGVVKTQTVEEAAEMEKDSNLGINTIDKSGTLGEEQEVGMMTQETCKNNERVQEAIRKQ